MVSKHFSLSATLNKVGCAVIVSKKVEKSSVGRHRLKRRVLASLAGVLTPGYAIVVYARAGSSALSYKELTQELRSMLAQLPPLPQVR